MCGIVGILNLDRVFVSKQEIERLMKSIKHRGPDGEGFYIDRYMGLGHVRLAILDPTDKGAQPMTSKNGEWVIIFNGCIYNFKELREQLRNLGHRFFSNSDTEVISEGLAEWGIDIFPMLNGMFAIAAWHVPTETLWLSRDRFGIKPLYYSFTQNSFLFGSEIKAILAHPSYKMAINFHALNEYFTFQNLFTFRTLFKDVYLLPPANTVKITYQTRELKHNAWWDYNFSEPDNKISFEEAVDEVKRLLRQAAIRQIIADVPVGSYLSGGMDSGSITSIASQHIPRLKTFTCGFDMNRITGVEANYDERKDAEIMSSIFQTEHYEQVINAGDLKWALPEVVWHLEDLRVGMSYPNYYISRLASKFVKVCLQGTGGDELFGGYPWRYYRVFHSLNQKEFLDNYYDYWQRLVPDNQKKELFTEKVLKEVDIDEPRRIFDRVFTFNKNLKYERPEDHIQNSLYFEAKTFLAALLLVGDKLAMANGLEERYPFLDNDLVEFAQRIPVRFKLGNLEAEIKRLDENLPGSQKRSLSYRTYDDGKNILRYAMDSFIPDIIKNRKKQGFSAPDENWYRGENAVYIENLLLNNKSLSSEFINKEYIRKIIQEHASGKANHRLLIWSFLNFEWWCRKFLL